MMSDATGTRRREANLEDLQRLLRRLGPDQNQAWQAYDTLRQKLVLFFAYHCGFQAEELADEVLDRIAKKPDSEEIANVAEFAFGVARNLRKEASRKASRAQVSDATLAGERFSSNQHPEDAIVNQIDSKRKLECFLICMRRLDAGDRRLLVQYYPSEDDGLEQRREKLAAEHRVNLGALRTRMARLREKVERCFQRCCSASRKQQGITKVTV